MLGLGGDMAQRDVCLCVCKGRSLDYNSLTTLPYTVFSPLTAAESLSVKESKSH